MPTAPDAREPSFFWREMRDSPLSTTYDNGQLASVTRKFLVENADLYRSPSGLITLRQAMAEVLGYASYTPSPDGTITRVLPVTDPDSSWMVAKRCDVRPVGSVGDKSDLTFDTDQTQERGNEAEQWQFTVTFQDVEYEIKADGEPGLGEIERYMIVEEAPRVEFRVSDAALFGWRPGVGNPAAPGVDPVPLGRAVGVPIYFNEITLHWLEVPEDAIRTDLEDFAGKANDSNLALPLGYSAAGNPQFASFPPGTVLFSSPKKSRRKRFPTGVAYRDLTLRFAYNPQSWRKAANKSGDYFDIVYLGDVTKFPIPETDLSLVFKGPAS